MGNQELIIEYVKRYISNDVGLNTAIMIKGAWGCGKTYFIKEILGPKLKPLLEKKNNHLCYISLNGISSINELMKRIQSIVLKTNFIFKGELSSYDIDIITGIDSIFDEINLQGLMNIAIGAKKKFEKRIVKNNLNTSVFVFDDLERCALPLKEILGAINDLVEHMKCKCIIVANEAEIDKVQDFTKIKEKFISRTIEFKPDINGFFTSQWEIYKNQPLGMLNNENWNAFMKEKSYSLDINLRTLQSVFSITNEIIEICKNVLSKENESITQHLLNKLINDVYKVEEYYKKGNPRPEINKEEILGLYNLSDSSDLFFSFEIFNFIFQIVYDGEYIDNIILNHISNYIQNIKTKNILSPITELKNYPLLEDEVIQEKLDQIDSNIKEMSLNQACDLFNILIPLLDLGFQYHRYSDFNQVLDYILNKINIYDSENSLLYSVVENHTFLKNEQYNKFIEATQKVKERLREKSIPKSQNIEVLLASNDWLEKLQNDIKEKEYDYRNEKKYLSYFNQDILLKRLEQCSNNQLSKFRDLLYRMYRRQNCLDSFVNDVESAHLLINRLESINITKKINKATIKYLIGDLKVSFPKEK